MEIFGLQVLGLIIGAVIGGFVSVLVYRNNEKKASVVFDKFDVKFDKLELRIEELKKKIEDSKRV